MQLSLKSLSGQFSRLLLLLLVLTSMPSCSKVLPSLLTGGGPNVAANIQAGKTNSQTIGTTENYAPSVSVRPNSRVDNIDQSKTENTVGTSENVTITNVSPWMMLFALIGWILPSPNEIARWFKNLFKKKT